MRGHGPSGDAPFGRRALVAVILAAAALGVTLFFYVFGEAPREVASAGADTFSRSALGYHALAAFLEEAGARVRVSRFEPLNAVGPDAGLLLLEPPSGEGRAAERAALVAGAVERGAPVVVVLPERRWRRDPDDPSRVGAVEPLAADRVARLLEVLFGEGEGPGARSPVRPRPVPGGVVLIGPSGPLASGLSPDLYRPQVLPRDLPGVEIRMTTSAGPVIVHDPDRRLTVVSDPDLLNTHGLARADNAVVAHRLLIGGDGAPAAWVVDETLHGYEVVPSLTRELLEMPLALFTWQSALLAVLGFWAAARRFGQPLQPPPRLPAGARTLIDNTARLLDFGGHHAEAVDRYLDAVVEDGAAVYGLPPGLGRRERVARLASAAAERGVTEDLEDIARRVLGLHGVDPRKAAPRAFDLARRLWAWREEVLHGAR